MHLPSKCRTLCISLQGCKQQGERGAAASSGAMHYGPGRTLLEVEVGIASEPTDHTPTLD